MIENVENIVNDVKQWIEGEIFVGYLNSYLYLVLVILVILLIF